MSVTSAARAFRPRPEPAPAARPAARPADYVISVEFEGDGGARWSAIGGGDTLRQALAFAREALPSGRRWRVARWNHLFGD